jgi:hypothetical protein
MLTIYENKDEHVSKLKKSINIQANRPRMSKISEEVRIHIISRLKLRQATKATHFLESQGQALSAG